MTPIWPPIEPPKTAPVDTPGTDLGRSRKRTRRSLIVAAGTLSAAGLAAWWVKSRGLEGNLAWPLRRVHQFNESLTAPLVGPGRLARVFPKASAADPRVNGLIDLYERPDASAWRVRIRRGNGLETPLSLAESVGSLTRLDLVTELCCVEGWSQVVWWQGVRLRDVLLRTGLVSRSGRQYPVDGPDPPVGDRFRYVALTTPEGGYHVGLDMASALHPQTLLVDRMNDEPLTPGHGAPLRLVIPIKYGIKNLKQVGVIRTLDERPDCYWAERGYDWFAGL
jgi:DMSO/TMAO reductase YedYZ molybdopterin-dependent catalytic subunit